MQSYLLPAILTSNSVPTVLQQVLRYWQQQGQSKLDCPNFDCSLIKQIDTAGIACLLFFKEQVKNKGGTVVFINKPDVINKLAALYKVSI